MNKTAQLTLTSNEGKRLIAYTVYNSDMFKKAYKNHKIIFKGSTTVSALSQLAVNEPLRICGRMTENGMKANKNQSDAAHWLLYHNGNIKNIDNELEDVIKNFTSEDLLITGANAIDAFGNAALLIGSPGGSGYGKVLSSMYAEGFPTLILTTTDKFIMGNINELYNKIHRSGCEYAYGMACGLAPIPGKIITEVEAMKLIGKVDAIMFSRGGIGHASGASAIQIEGELSEVEKVLSAVDNIRNSYEQMGDEVSLQECSFPSMGCGQHLSCKYSKKNTIHK